MAKKTDKPKEDNKLSIIVDFSGFVELPEGMTPEKRAEEIKAQIASLSIQTLADKDDYKVGRKLLTDLVTLRTTIEKVRKEKNGPISEAKKRIDDTAKTLTALFQSHENDLSVKVKAYEKLEEDEKNKITIRNQARQAYLIQNFFPYNGESFVCTMADGSVLATITPRTIALSDDAEWQTILDNIINPNSEKVRAEQEQIRIKEEEDRKAFEEFKRQQELAQKKDEPMAEPFQMEVDKETFDLAEKVVGSSLTITSRPSGEVSYVNVPSSTNQAIAKELDKTLSLFEQLCKNQVAIMQLKAIIDKQKKDLGV